MSETPPILLRPVGKGRPVDRQAARALWKSGKVVGLFNLPSEDAFMACSDFCMEDATLMSSEQEEVTKMKAQLRTAIEKSVAATKEALEAREKLAEAAKKRLLEQEDFESKQRRFEEQKSAWAKEKKSMKRALDERDSEIKALKSQVQDLQKRDAERHAVEQELRAELSAAGQEIQEQLRDERASLAGVVQENKDLLSRIRLLETENEQLRQSTVQLTTTDLMNRKALLQYLERINSHQPVIPAAIDGPVYEQGPTLSVSNFASSPLFSTNYDGGSSNTQEDPEDDAWS